MRSVICSSVSSSVAPGHCAVTVMALMVNVGSSLRPSFMYETTPMMTSIAMK
jgi:hypothetical protein